MKRIGLLLIIGLVALPLIMVSCGKTPEVAEEIPVDTVVVVDTPKPEPPPPPPPPKLSESQFETIHFDFDKSNLKPLARAGLDKNYQLLREFPDVIVQIEGHCDERGTVEYNLSLGERRAKAARDYLVGLGIDANRLQIISYGKERPLDPRSNEEAWAKNRRAEFRIISQ
jgi:peptidoglycan-associated lipoprotein